MIPVDGRPLVNHWLELLTEAGLAKSDVYIITNAHFNQAFLEWAKSNDVPASNIINDGSTDNENRLGACRDIAFACEKANIDDDLMVIGGDTLFFEDFKLTDVLSEFNKRGTNVILSYPIVNDIDTLKTGVLELDSNHIVVNMLEKPHPDMTTSRLGCPCFYFYNKKTLNRLNEFISGAKSLAEADAPGHYVAWVWSREPCYAHHVSGRYDIGGLQSLIECEKEIQTKKVASK